MPYIDQTKRQDIDDLLESFYDHFQEMNMDEGAINYIVTRIMLEFLGHNPKYADYNAAIGVLECAKLELYRRRVSPYEDIKLYENGDVER